MKVRYNPMTAYKIIPVSKGKEMFVNFDTKRKSYSYAKIGPKVGQYLRTYDSGKFGFITILKDVCLPKYTSLPNIEELFFYGFARVQNSNGWGLVNSDGIEILKPQFEEIYIPTECHGNIVIVGKTDEQECMRYGLYFPELNKITEIRYSDFDMKEGYIETELSSCDTDGKETRKYKGLLLYDGTEVFEPTYESVSVFYGDMFKATDFAGKQYLNSVNWMNMSVGADEFYEPVQGFIKVRNARYYAFINVKTGRNITTFKYRDAGRFNEFGFASVKDGITWKFIDTRGTEYTRKFKKLTTN